jgi:oligosaccharide repeat unit polymerase
MHYSKSDSGYGFYTFMNIFRLFGETRYVPMGTYDEYMYYQDYFQTNIFTVFRGIIIDFGIFGSFLFFFCFGFIVHLFFHLFLCLKYPVVSTSFFIISLAFFQMSQLISLMMYNSTYILFVILSVIFLINKHNYKGRKIKT